MSATLGEFDRRLRHEVVDRQIMSTAQDAVRHSLSHSTKTDKTYSHGVTPLLEPAGAGLLTADNGPILVPIVMRDCREQSITERIAARQRHSSSLGGSHDEAEILETQKRRETHLVVRFIHHDLAVDLVSR